MTAEATNPANIEFQIGGMTCASCAMRIEKKLNKLDGVEASVNYATEKARITSTGALDPQVLITEVEKTGYTAALPAAPEDKTGSGSEDDSIEGQELVVLRQRLIGAAVLSVPVIAMAMIPVLQFDYWASPPWCWPPQWWCGPGGPSIGLR